MRKSKNRTLGDEMISLHRKDRLSFGEFLIKYLPDIEAEIESSRGTASFWYVKERQYRAQLLDICMWDSLFRTHKFSDVFHLLGFVWLHGEPDNHDPNLMCAAQHLWDFYENYCAGITVAGETRE